MKITTDTIRKVYIDNEGVYIQVAPDADALGLLELTVPDVRSVEFFGNCNIIMSTDYARQLALAILHCCSDIEGSK